MWGFFSILQRLTWLLRAPKPIQRCTPVSTRSPTYHVLLHASCQPNQWMDKVISMNAKTCEIFFNYTWRSMANTRWELKWEKYVKVPKLNLHKKWTQIEVNFEMHLIGRIKHIMKTCWKNSSLIASDNDTVFLSLQFRQTFNCLQRFKI